MSEQFHLILLGIIGFLFISTLSRIWFSINNKKSNKALVTVEHYHYGIVAFIMSFVFFEYSTAISYLLLGAGGAFVYFETKQKNYFAKNSTHFRNSSILGISLIAIAAISYIYSFTSIFNF